MGNKRMTTDDGNGNGDRSCREAQARILESRDLIIASNRGPVTWQFNEYGELEGHRGSGGLVTALLGLTQHVDACWVACALTDADRAWREGSVLFEEQSTEINVKFILPKEDAYDGYYNVIANPMLWFLQHIMWDNVRSPTIDASTWRAWNEGYVEVNRQFAEVIADEIRSSSRQPVVMLQDYHLYLAPRHIRKRLPHGKKYSLQHFIHIPWPGSKNWGLLPPQMRQAILDGLCAVDLLGFQTQEDGLNFIRTCETHLPDCKVNYRNGLVTYCNHVTYVRDFPISIDVQALKELAKSDEVEKFRRLLDGRFGHNQLIVRVDRTEPSKNILRGFQAFDEMLDLYPEHRGSVQFLAILVPSRLEVAEYQSYLDELMAAAGRVNARYGDSEWEPVRILVGENYHRAIAALQLYDVLLVNSIADGMNLVAKEGPTVNQRNGVVILSEKTGARQQLEPGALIISPWDIYSTAQALHAALMMPPDERARRARKLRNLVESADITDWLCDQLNALEEISR
jgi:trehalose 6-phosphate synthase